MKRPFIFAVFWLLAALAAPAAGPAAPDAPGRPLAVQLNGMTRMVGLNYACFVFYQPTLSKYRSFMLAEGETKFGVKLLAVDVASGCVQIENCGQKQSLRICSTPALVYRPLNSGATGSPAKPGPRGGNSLVDGNFVGSAGPDGSVDGSTAGNSAWSGGGPAKNGNNSNPNSAADPNSSSGQNTDPGQSSDGSSNPGGMDPAITFKDQSDSEWYQESANIEQSRIDTAPSVLAGEMSPWPRTPLTPAGTPGNLVGDETFFSNHIPGFKQQAPPIPTE